MRSLVDDAASADEDAPESRFELGARVNYALGLDGDGMRALQDGVGGDGEGGGEIDRRFRAIFVGNWKSRASLARHCERASLLRREAGDSQLVDIAS